MGNNESKKKQINEENAEEEAYYSEIIKDLKIDTKKVEKNLKNSKKYKEYIILIESGSLAPPHKMHLGIMEITKSYFEQKDKNRKVIGGYLIPSSDQYVKYKLKKDFINLKQRVNMTNLLIKNSEWLESLDWGLAYGEEIKLLLQKIINKKFPKYNIKCMLVFGVDYYLRDRMYLKDEHICIIRPGYDVDKVKKLYTENLIFIEGKDEDISSTKIRKAIRENDEKTIIELTSKEIVDYIKNNNIFEDNQKTMKNDE